MCARSSAAVTLEYRLFMSSFIDRIPIILLIGLPAWQLLPIPRNEIRRPSDDRVFPGLSNASVPGGCFVRVRLSTVLILTAIAANGDWSEAECRPLGRT